MRMVAMYCDPVLTDLFLCDQAKKHGAQTVEAGSKDAGKSGDSKPKYFGGGGYKLGESEGASEFVPAEEETPEVRPV